jgi:hypothetical protein
MLGFQTPCVTDEEEWGYDIEKSRSCLFLTFIYLFLNNIFGSEWVVLLIFI